MEVRPGNRPANVVSLRRCAAVFAWSGAAATVIAMAVVNINNAALMPAHNSIEARFKVFFSLAP